MKMPFGRFVGAPLWALPYQYLAWLQELDDLREPLKSAVRKEWERRLDQSYHSDADQFPDEENQLYAALIEAGYKALAQKFHPDHGGSTQAMQRLNDLIRKLRKPLGVSA